MPASPNRPIAVLPYLYGGPDSRNAIEVHSALKQPIAAAPSAIRWRSSGSRATSRTTDLSSERYGRQDRDDQAAALEQVAERDQEREPDRIADLRRRDEQARGAVRD